MSPATIFSLSLKNLEHFYYKITGQTHKIIPYKILIEVTTLCNSRCVNCYIWKIEKEDLTYVPLDGLEVFLKKMGNNLRWVALSGGEVSNYSQLPELVALLKKYNPRLRIITFTTNGLLPKRILEQALLLKNELKCDTFITVSLDGDKQTHDAIRGVKGNYEKAMETYELLKKNNIPCHFGLTVSPENHGFITQSYGSYRDTMKAVTFMHTEGIYLTGEGHGSKAADASIIESLRAINKKYKISALGEIIMKISIKTAILFLKKERKTNIIPCDAGLSSVHVFSNGEIAPCMFYPGFEKLGPSFELKDFHNEKAVAMREEIKNDKCKHCWMNCYAPHSILQAPLKSLSVLLKPV